MVSTFQIRPNIMSIFDQCMVQKNAPCLDINGAIIPNRGMPPFFSSYLLFLSSSFSLSDRFVCGNDLVNPGLFFTTSNGICDLNSIPSSSDDCRFLMLERALNQDSLGVRVWLS
jgi:hypothetical protein